MLSDPVSLEVIKQINMTNPFIQYHIDEETVICSGITSKELEVSFLSSPVCLFGSRV